MARGLARALAAYFSDVLLWISVAGALEVVAVIGMALLCILSAGYFFENMKKNPVVLVLGGIVALAGTFLMFREVRGMIWSPPAVVAAPAQQGPSPSPTDAVSPPSAPSREGAKPLDLTCTGLPELSCSTNQKCLWLPTVKMCMTRLTTQPMPSWNFPNPSQLSTCTLLPAEACKGTSGCYWSPLFDRCERLIVGTALGAAKPSQPSCNGLSEPQCRSRSGCLWILNGCMTDLLKKPPQ